MVVIKGAWRPRMTQFVKGANLNRSWVKRGATVVFSWKIRCKIVSVLSAFAEEERGPRTIYSCMHFELHAMHIMWGPTNQKHSPRIFLLCF